MFAVGRSSNTLRYQKFFWKRNIFDQARKIFASDNINPIPPDTNFVDFVWKDHHRWASRTAVTCGISGRSLTYGQTFGAFDRLSVNLPAKLGLKSGDVVALLLPNVPEFPIAFFGAASAGLVVSPLNPLYTPDELAKLFACSKAKAVVTISSLLPNVKSAFEKNPGVGMPVILVDGADTEDQISLERLTTEIIRGAERLEKPGPESLIALPFSSGTTGVPKGVVLNHLNLVANVCGINHRDSIPFFETGSTIAVIPFFHIYGTVIFMGMTFNRGHHLVTLPKFDPLTFNNAIKTYKPTSLFLVPPLMLHLARSPQITSETLKNLKFIGTGAAPITGQTLDEVVLKTQINGTIVKNGFGMTETAGMISIMTDSIKVGQKAISIGTISSNAEVKIVGENDETLPLGEEGELWIRGPQVMKGYLDNKEATKEILTEDGWLKTGDVARLDEHGAIYIVDRLKDIIKVKGFQVSPTELEDIIVKMEGVADVAVVGVSIGEDEGPKACVVKKKDSNISAEDVISYLDAKVAKFKRLTGGVQFVDQIPRSAAGKILKKDISVAM
ncbi:uncharacterized protein LOC132200520 [Neocloeon triangulifer]|uniref:uncharacterized protein LOC132200520 n=1 Tax=Neocloeon triangulifer TaxID=2078957 RepID=UPI00286F7C9C|nr:uncharacterized protein LOC132200520 [Neocloeon triangulifer]